MAAKSPKAGALVRKLCRTLAEVQALSRQSAMRHSAQRAAASLSTSIAEELQKEPSLCDDPNTSSAVVATGDPRLIDLLLTRRRTEIVLERRHWSLLFDAAEPRFVQQLFEKNLISPKNLPVVAIGRVRKHGPEAINLLMALPGRPLMSSDIIRKNHRKLMQCPKAAPFTAAFLERQVASYPQYYAEAARNFVGDGDLFPALSLHLAGVPIEKLRVDRPKPSRARAFLQLIAANHGILKLRQAFPTLPEFLAQPKKFEKWAQNLI